VDADMLVVQQRIAGGEQEYRREQIPLQFEPAVGADVEGIAHARIAGADHDRGQNQPVDEMPDPLVQRVNRAAQAQQKRQFRTSQSLIRSGLSAFPIRHSRESGNPGATALSLATGPPPMPVRTAFRPPAPVNDRDLVALRQSPIRRSRALLAGGRSAQTARRSFSL